ncbi:MAG: hypothetical protein NXH87_16365 [Rhodobiaceae bacterium]|nr:hypothetical protein [Rhodobiaceae bacterium]
MKKRYIGIAGAAGGLLWATAASAASYSSSYSDLDLGRCALIEEESEIGFVQVKCSGQHGYDVYATEGDLRLYLAYRKPGEPLIIEEEPAEVEETAEPVLDPLEAAVEETDVIVDVVETEPEEPVDVFVPVGVRPLGETIPPFNNLGPKLEWRAPNRAGAAPFATIVRYTYQQMAEDGSYSNGQVLVVSRFRSGESCHVAYIDALANANANVMAREVADKYATGGTCPDGAVPVLGRGGEEFRF